LWPFTISLVLKGHSWVLFEQTTIFSTATILFPCFLLYRLFSCTSRIRETSPVPSVDVNGRVFMKLVAPSFLVFPQTKYDYSLSLGGESLLSLGCLPSSPVFFSYHLSFPTVRLRTRRLLFFFTLILWRVFSFFTLAIVSELAT